MTSSSTSVTGTIGELAVIAAILKEGFDVFKEVTNSSDIDLVALKGDRFVRVQVKTASVSHRGGAAVFPLRKGGKESFRGDEFDVMALYIVEKDIVLFASMKELMQNKTGFSVRLSPPRNGAEKGIRQLENYLSFTISAGVA